MKKNFSQKLDDLLQQAEKKLIEKLRKSKTKSDFRNQNCLKVTDEIFMFNLDGNRYLAEIIFAGKDEIELVDNNGYSYAHFVLSTSAFLKVADHLLGKK